MKIKQFKKVVRIYCEGDTEKNYIQSMFADRYSGLSKFILPTIKNSVKDIMDIFSEEFMDSDSGILAGLFLVLDLDAIRKQHKLQKYNDLIKTLNKENPKNLYFIESQPCIEYWFLLHFVYQDKLFVNCQEVLKELKKRGRLPDYDKKNKYTTTVYEKLKQDINTAIKNSNTNASKKNQRQPGEEYSYTYMHKMIEALDAIYKS